jgi:uncharacterized repeat protein (TIGR01451 family)
MNRVQLPFQAQGLDVPSYVSLGNHDRLQQGNQYSNASFEAVATGCAKIYEGNQTAPVPRDPERRSLSYPQLRAMYDTGAQADAHGFKRVDPAELAASNGAASYYSWSPRPGVRMISLNTLSEGGQTGPSAAGNLDDPQFQWLKGELAKAQTAGQLVILFGHHPIASMDSPIPDENAPSCGPDPNTDPNKGCDLDQRASTPIHQGPDLEALLKANKNVVAYVAGHTTVNRIIPFQRAGGGGFWQIESGSVSDWPNQARLVELMDNRDRTLSIFGTMLAQDSPIDIPVPPTLAGSFTPSTLASIDRVFAFNDAQDQNATDERIGLTLNDRNVELLLPDPRQANLKLTKLDNPDPVRTGGILTYTLRVENLGPARATGVTVRDRLPDNVRFVSVSATRGSCSGSDVTVRCDLGDLAAGRKPQITIKVRVQGGARTIINWATVDAITDDPHPLHNKDSEDTRVIP